ncbi:Protein Hook 1 [Gonapodya sp. JEL0774]|nr:Protein Hook 1 [Gonapodya sp. JEL0774]
MPTDSPELAKGVVSWVNAVLLPSYPGLAAAVVADLADGAAFAAILCEIDPTWFASIKTLECGPNWVLKYNNLKRLAQLVNGYFEEVLGLSVQLLEQPNLNAVARDAETHETLKLAALVVAVAVQCEDNQRYIQLIQSLDQTSQHALMVVIENVIQRLQGDVPDEDEEPEPHVDPDLETELGGSGHSAAAASAYNGFSEREKELAEENNALMDQIAEYREQLDQNLSESEQLLARVTDLEQQLTQAKQAQRDGKVDFLLRSEIGALKRELEESDARRQESQQRYEKEREEHLELQRKLDSLARDADEIPRLKDELSSLRLIADQHAKAEAALERFRKRAEESVELRRELTNVKEECEAARLELERVREEYTRLLDARTQGAGEKYQVEQLESKLRMLAKEKSMAEMDANKWKEMAEREQEARKEADMRTVELEERLAESDVAGAAARAASRDIGNDYEDRSHLLSQVSHLERELADARSKSVRDDSLREELEKTKAELRATRAELERANAEAKVQNNSELAEALAKLAAEVERSKQLEARNSTLEKALKKAKDYIVTQDSTIKELKAAGVGSDAVNFNEALTSLKSEIAAKESDIARLRKTLEETKDALDETRSSARREQRLLMSAWYDVGMQLQRRSMGMNGQPQMVAGKAPPSPVGSSWLAQQRASLDQRLRR